MAPIRLIRAIVDRLLALTPWREREQWVEPSNWITRAIDASVAAELPPEQGDIELGPPRTAAGDRAAASSDHTDAAA